MTTYTGSTLIAQIDGLHVPAGMLAVWSLGQSGLVLKGGQTVAYIDPYLSNRIADDWGGPRREFPTPVEPHQVTNAQVVFCTHEHADHTDPWTLGPLAQASPQAVFVGPANSRDILREVGVPDERMIVPRMDEAREVGDLTFTPLPAAHYELDYDPQRGYRWLGFLIELNGVTLYHSGDTILFGDLVDRLRLHRIDLACLPVNGRDYWREQRNLTGNLDGPEAAELVDLLDVDVLIPMHNDLFAGNHVTPAILADFLDRHTPRQKYHWLQPGELYLYVK